MSRHQKSNRIRLPRIQHLLISHFHPLQSLGFARDHGKCALRQRIRTRLSCLMLVYWKERYEWLKVLKETGSWRCPKNFLFDEMTRQQIPAADTRRRKWAARRAWWAQLCYVTLLLKRNSRTFILNKVALQYCSWIKELPLRQLERNEMFTCWVLQI